MDTTFKEKFSSSNSINADNGNDGGTDIDAAADNGGHQGGAATETDGFEEHRRVESDDVHAGELLESGNSDGENQLRAVLPSQQSGPRMLHVAGSLAGSDEIFELLVHVGDSADAKKLLFGCLVLVPFDEGVGGLGKAQSSDDDDQRRDRSAAQTQSPSPPSFDLREQIVQNVGYENSDGDCELEHDVQSTSVLVRCHLRHIDRHRLYI